MNLELALHMAKSVTTVDWRIIMHVHVKIMIPIFTHNSKMEQIPSCQIMGRASDPTGNLKHSIMGRNPNPTVDKIFLDIKHYDQPIQGMVTNQ